MRLGFWVAVAGLAAACGSRTDFVDYDEDGAGSAGRGGGASSGGAGRGPGAAAGRGGTATGSGKGGRGPGGSSTGGSGMTTPTACYKDTDCPGAQCGGQVCNWTKVAPSPMAEKVFLCNAAGTDPPTQDGWCTTDADCKCAPQGARCVVPYCTFTLPRVAE